MYKEAIRKILNECGFPPNFVKPDSAADRAGEGQLMLDAMNEQANFISQKMSEFHSTSEIQVVAGSIFLTRTAVQVNKEYFSESSVKLILK